MNNQFDAFPLDTESNVFQPRIDIGVAFADHYVPADYTPVLDELKNLVPMIESRLGRAVSDAECRVCQGMLRQQYQESYPLGHSDVAQVVFKTNFLICGDSPICLLVTMKRRDSIKLNASKKITQLELVGPEGAVIGTLQSLPFFISNLTDVGFALRASHPNTAWNFLLSCIVSKWVAIGAPRNLPCDIPLLVTSEGVELAIRLRPYGNATRATMLVNGIEVEPIKLLPAIFKEVAPCALGRESMYDLADMLGIDGLGKSYLELQFDVRQVYEFMSRWQVRNPGILRTCICGDPVLVFHSGKANDEGESIFGVCRTPGNDGRYTEVTWTTERNLSVLLGDGIPAAPDWEQGGDLNFTPSLAVENAGDHLLAHARRWAPDELLAQGIDERGFDRFVDDQARAQAMSLLEAELNKAVARASRIPADVKPGFYPSLAAKTESTVSPICFYLPAFFQDDGIPKAIFALRSVKKESKTHYVAVTVLTPLYAERAIRQIGACPNWLKIAS